MSMHSNNTDGKDPRFVFFGTPSFAVTILEELEEKGFLPALVVTAPNRPAGRGLALTPSPVKRWAEEHSVPVATPEKLHDQGFIARLREVGAPVFVLAAYGKIVPSTVLDVPPQGILNVHPSLLPRYRGASPVESQILANELNIGVSVMLLDEKMDHGPIVATQEVEVPRPLPDAPTLENTLAHAGGKLLAESLLPYFDGQIEPQKQDHEAVTYTKKFTKEDAELDLNSDPLENYLKIQAFKRRPRAFFFVKKGDERIRVIPTRARYEQGELVIERVVPEGGKEVDYETFRRSL